MVLKKYGNIWAPRKHLGHSDVDISIVQELGQGPQNVIIIPYSSTAYHALPALRVEYLWHLRKLHIHDRPLSCPNEPTSFKISIKHFGYTTIFLPHLVYLDGPLHSSCLSILNTATLRCLELSADHTLDHLKHLFEDKDIMESSHSLHTLSISFLCIDEADIYAVPPAPQLSRYKGPSALLPLRRGVAEYADKDGKGIAVLATRVVLQRMCTGAPSCSNSSRISRSVSSDDANAVEPSELRTTSRTCEQLKNILTVPPTLSGVFFRWWLTRTQDEEVEHILRIFALHCSKVSAHPYNYISRSTDVTPEEGRIRDATLQGFIA
ncbi:hypothetical protein MVEN_02639000 [Mycena venus]|uniref:Uncharacterized protein n=1 Tax=Mycena venus TaxID=2733690 RepID=A0A8H6TTZ7_9AGAR|nr:hypothetical protein MVEN_02639000 [Mycena venus]